MIPEEIGERIEEIQVNNYFASCLTLSPGLAIRNSQSILC